MSFSHQDLAQLTRELQAKLLGGQLQKLTQPTYRALILVFYRQQSWSLLVNAEPGNTFALLTQERQKPLAKPPNFLLFAKKQITGKRLERITLIQRRLHFQIGGLTLVAELNPARANIFLLDSQGKVLRALVGNNQWVGQSLVEQNLADDSGAPLVPPGEGDFSKRAAAWLKMKSEQHGLHEGRQGENRLIKRMERKLDHLQQDLQEAALAEQSLNYGEALKSYSFSPGIEPNRTVSASVSLLIKGKAVEIPLPRAMTLKQLMQHYFTQHRKLLRKGQIAKERLATTQHQLAQLKTMKPESATSQAGLLKKPPLAKPPERRLPPGISEHLSPDDYRILLGKNAAANDALLKLAQGDDLWLHVRDFAGSHCLIVKKGKAPVPERTLFWAASLALRHSKGAAQGKGDVTIARRADVKKFKGAKPGQVRVVRGKTIHVKLN